MKTSTKKLTTMAMLAALSIVLISIVHFPLFPSAPWMEYDPADIPIFIGTFLFGPISGLLLTVAVSVSLPRFSWAPRLMRSFRCCFR